MPPATDADIDGALLRGSALVDRDPVRARWQLQLGRAAALAGDVDLATIAWTAAADLSPDDPHAADLLHALEVAVIDEPTMEPNDDDGGVPVVDFTMDTAAGTASELIVVVDHVTVRYPSFEDFYRTNRTSIGRALALTLRDTALAAEAIDEAMARAYQRWPHVSQLENPGGWVYRVALNWSRSVLRRLTRSGAHVGRAGRPHRRRRSCRTRPSIERWPR